MKYSFLVLFCLILLNPVSARHIIGGSITYTRLSQNLYSIRLEVLRDCFSAGAQFDNPASIGIFRPDGSLLFEILVPYTGGDTISVDPNSLCTFPPHVCVDKAVYATTVNIPDLEFVTIAYQRCCRSDIILNLVNPLENGMTFHTQISPLIINSSPRFKKDVPSAVFTNTGFVYDASASDPDGDSLAYELINPFYGGDQLNFQPQPPPPPPYEQGAFLPPYSLANMIGGTPLTINPTTGEMTAIPQITGVFQIAYSVKEYRNGELLTTIYREFAFVVIPPPHDLQYHVSGTVLINDTVPLDAGKVQIFQRDISSDSLFLYDEQNIGIGATYAFDDIPAGVFYIKAIVDTGSVYYDLYLPTYYNYAPYWYLATHINQCDTSQYYRDIHLIHVDSLAGIIDLDGIVTLAGRNNIPVAGLNLLLVNESGDILQARTTNQIGYFKFEQLISGTYQIFVDLLNSPIDNSNPPVIAINANTTIHLFLYEDSLSFQMPVSIRPELTAQPGLISIYPNPSSEEIFLHIEDESLDHDVQYTIMDLTGKKLITGLVYPDQDVCVNIQKLVNGIYILRAQSEFGYSICSFIKH